MNQSKDFLALLAACAQLNKIEMHPVLFALYEESAQKIGYGPWMVALKEGLRHRNFPTVAEVEETCGAVELFSDKDKAKEAAEKIWAAIVKFGWPNTAAAASWMGDLAWAIVQAQGRWEEVCEAANEDNRTYLIHQWAESGERLIKRQLMQGYTQHQLNKGFDAMAFIEAAKKELE